MGLSIQQLHTQVTHLAQENGDATGKLRGAVAANTQGSFQGLTVSNGARETEKAFAMDILKHTSNIILNSYDQAELFSGSARLGKNNFVLEQVGGGQSRFVGLKSDQLTLRDAKILLEAAMRPPVPLRSNTPPPIQMGSDIPPPVPARNGTPP
ncbi:protein-tyrosine phosphatase Yop effector, partial [Vibrio sp. AND4]